jgi:cytochrome c oxidase assembly protein subunit 15
MTTTQAEVAATDVARASAIPFPVPAALRGSRRLSAVLVGLTFFLIFWGGQVTTTLSGDSVPTWPSSFFIPQDAPQLWELGHRWIAGVVGLVTLWLCVMVLRSDHRPACRKLVIAAAVLVVVQALVGGVRVRLGESHHNAWPIAHTLLAQSFLAVVVALAAALRHAGAPAHPNPAAVSEAFRRGWTLVGVTWLQAGLGAVLRHETQAKNQLGLVLHVAGAMLVIIAAVRLIATINAHLAGDLRFKVPAHLLFAAMAVQIILGLSAWVTTHTPDGYVNPTDASSLVPTLHLVLGSAILALGVVLAMRARGAPR